MDKQQKWVHPKRKRHLRILAVMLCFCVLFTAHPDYLTAFSVFAADMQEQPTVQYVSAFSELSEEVCKQTVPIGTGQEALLLPDTLEAVIFQRDGELSTEDGKILENEAECTKSADTKPVTEEPADTEKTSLDATAEENKKDAVTQEDAEQDADVKYPQDAADIEKDTDEKSPQDADSDGEAALSDKQENNEITLEVHTVTMQKCYAENVISVQTLEGTSAKEQEETATIDGVTWQSEPAYDKNTEGVYTFIAILPDGYALAEGVILPQITVTVIESTDSLMQALLERMAALPEVDVFLAEEPDMEEDEDAYAQWTETLYAYAEEAVAIWEEYAALTEEQKAQITEEELAKLTAWVELAGALSDNEALLADDTPHTHCVCVGNTDIGDHTSHTDTVYDKIIASNDSGQLLINGTVQEDYTLASGNYYLAGDAAFQSELIIAENSTVSICLNGHVLRHDSTEGCVIDMRENSALTLSDCDKEAKGCITGGKGHDVLGRRGGAIYMYGAAFNMFGGTIKENKSVQGGGAIYSDSTLYSAMNIYGGKIANNSVSNAGGGGLYGEKAHIKIFGGSIEENAAQRGGGIFIQSGDVTISNASVVNNKISSIWGGGIGSGRGTGVVFSISGKVNITGNESDGVTNNIYFGNGTFFDVTGNLEGSSIGVTTQSKPVDPIKIAEGGTNPASGDEYTISTADWNCFFSDNIDYEILRDEENNQLLLGVPKEDDTPHIHDGNTYTKLTEDNMALTDGTYYLSKNLNMGTITTAGDVTLCLNGHTLTHIGDTGSVIVVESGTFTLCDCKEDWDYTSTYNDSTKTYTYKITGSGGSLTGGKGSNVNNDIFGGGVYVSPNAVFHMNSGRITDCHVEKENTSSTHLADGGGVYVDVGGTFHMLGGYIDTNRASKGGGVDGNAFTLSISENAVIMNNKASGAGGGISAKGSFNMTGGKILGNVSGSYGGGVAAGSCEFMMTDGSIEGNICESVSRGVAGLYISSNSTVKLLGGHIRNNSTTLTTASSYKSVGGVLIIAPKNVNLYMSGDIDISDNYCNNELGNVLVPNNGNIKVIGKLSNHIGITTQNEPTATTPVIVTVGENYTITDDDRNCFFSDDDKYTILKKTTDTGNELYLAVPFTISANGAELSPEFDAFTTEYTASVANNVETVGITAAVGAVAADTTSLTMKVNGVTQSTMTSGQEQAADLAIGDNTIAIIVTDANGVSQTYALVITRADKQASPVTVTTYKDGVKWEKPSADYRLTNDNGATFVTDLSAVPDGTFRVYDGDTDTKVDVTVNGAEAVAEVHYYTVTFYDGSQKLTIPSQQTVLSGDVASAPTDKPARTGYTFDKWVTADGGSIEYKFTENIMEKTSLYAGWKPVSYKIEYHLDGGMVTGNPTSYTIEDSAITLNNPTKEGYKFTGWSGADLTGNDTSVTIASGSTGDRTYTAHWKAADYTVILHTNGGSSGTDLTSYTFGTGAILPTNWTKKGYVFDGWYDNENFTGTAVTNILGTDTGNKEYWAKWTDNIAPVIGTLIYNYQPKNFWHWLIGKDSLMITVPVTEEGSGADEITYTVTPEGGTASTKTAVIKDGEAKITVFAYFKGTISITCTDKANNTSASVTVGADLGANGIIIEDHAPEIAFKAENAELLPSGEYKTVPDIAVTVTDDKDNAVSGGIASVSYQIGGGSVKTVSHDYTTSMVESDSFMIPASKIPVGETVISVTATDNAGNSVTQNYTVKVHTHGGTLVPAVEPTCTAAGNKEYYTCTCGKWFSDSGCKNEITDKSNVVVNALGHDFSGEYLFDTVEHWQKCSRCAETSLREEHRFETNGTQCTVCDYEKAGEGHVHKGKSHDATEPTCTLPGNIAYYTCTCGKLFSDSECTVEITAQDVTIPAKGHTAVTDPAKAATCTETGLSEGSHCSVCGHVIKAQTVTAALGHDFGGKYRYDTKEHWKECSRCKAVDAKHSHRYDNNKDTTCNDCDYKRKIKKPGSENKNDSEDKQPTPTPPPKPAPTPTVTPNPPQPVPKPAPQPSDNTNPPQPAPNPPKPVSQPSDASNPPQPENGMLPESGITPLPEPETQPQKQEFWDDTLSDAIGQGTVIVTLNNVDETICTARVADTVAVARAVLSKEEITQVQQGQVVEIRIDVERPESVPEEDAQVIEKGIADCKKELPDLVMGMYVDISMFMRVGDSDWHSVHTTKEPVEIVLDIPQELVTLAADFYIMRAHDGEYLLLTDLDETQETITINTEAFSTYAILYQEQERAAMPKENKTEHKCGLCHICPTFLGICYFIWLAIILAVILIIWLIARRKKENKK